MSHKFIIFWQLIIQTFHFINFTLAASVSLLFLYFKSNFYQNMSHMEPTRFWLRVGMSRKHLILFQCWADLPVRKSWPIKTSHVDVDKSLPYSTVGFWLVCLNTLTEQSVRLSATSASWCSWVGPNKDALVGFSCVHTWLASIPNHEFEFFER